MSSEIERIKPQIINGIEFYVSSDGSTAGCSRPGVAALCGIPRQTINRLVETYSQQEGADGRIPKSLKALLAEPYYQQLIGINDAKILKEEVCIAIIEYYAFTSPHKSDVAAFSYRKFAAMGWHNWVLDVTGHKARRDVDMAPALYGAIREELKLLRGEIVILTNIKRVAQESHPGLGVLMEEYGKGIPKIPAGLSEPFTYTQWAYATQLSREERESLYLRRRIAEGVKVLRGARRLKTRSSNVLYYYSDLPAFEAALREIRE